MMFSLDLVQATRSHYKEGENMTVDRYIRLIAGVFIMASAALAHWVNPNWLFFTAFVGLNLFQSAFTDWCPMMGILRKFGVRG